MFMAVVTVCQIAMTNCAEYKSGPHPHDVCYSAIERMMKAVDAHYDHKAETLIGECVVTGNGGKRA